MTALPARVRISKLPAPVSQNVLAQLARLAPNADPAGRLAAGEPGWVASAGGRVIGLRLGGGESHPPLLVVDMNWRGKGVESALEGAAESAAP